jgi:hypothetical protein
LASSVVGAVVYIVLDSGNTSRLHSFGSMRPTWRKRLSRMRLIETVCGSRTRPWSGDRRSARPRLSLGGAGTSRLGNLAGSPSGRWPAPNLAHNRGARPRSHRR